MAEPDLERIKLRLMPEPVAWLITYGDRRQFQMAILGDQAHAAQRARELHGEVEALVRLRDVLTPLPAGD